MTKAQNLELAKKLTLQLSEQRNQMANEMREGARDFEEKGIPYIAFSWQTGYIIISQGRFNRLKKNQQTKLLKPVLNEMKNEEETINGN